MQPELGAALPFAPRTVSFRGPLKGWKIGSGCVQVARRRGGLRCGDLRAGLIRKSCVLHQAFDDLIAAPFRETLECSHTAIILPFVMFGGELGLQLLQRGHMIERPILDAAGMLRPIRFPSYCRER